MEFLRFLFIAILALYIIRAAARLLLPWLFQTVVNKAQDAQQQQYRQNKPEGRITIDHIPEKPKSKIPDSEGDFVEYEDVK